MKIEHLRNQKFHILDGDYVPSSQWESMIAESYYSDGHESFSRDCFVTLKSEDFEFDVEFDVYVRGDVTEEKGDYHNPPMTYVDISEDKIIVSRICVDGEEVGDSDLNQFLSKTIQNII
jgi:hypothetical protein